MAYVLKPKTMPIAIDSTKNSIAALDMLLLPACPIILSWFELKVMFNGPRLVVTDMSTSQKREELTLSK